MSSNPKFRVSLNCQALGDNLVRDGWIKECLSAPTRAELLVSTTVRKELGPILDVASTVQATIDDATARTFHLRVTRIQYLGCRSEQHLYRVFLAHHLADLALRGDVRMFQQKDVKAIVTSVLTGAGLDGSVLQFSLEGALEPYVYCTQYRESDAAFVHRLLEHEGIFYFLSETEAESNVCFSDQAQNAEAVDESPELPLVKRGYGEGVRDFRLDYAMVRDLCVLRDYNYETPTIDLTAEVGVGDPPQSSWYEFPGGYDKPAVGAKLARIRAEEQAANQCTAHGVSARLSFRPGCWFELTDTVRPEQQTKYLLREVTHHFSVYTLESNLDERETYRNEFVCSPLAQSYRPPRLTDAPIAVGYDSVVAAGPAGEEIFTDEQGRAKGKFFWDRLGSADQNASCWMRVAQLPIGGSMALVRVGWEMLVQYTYGDPNRPIMTGRVDNAVHTAPYAFPGAVTSMALKTLSSPGASKHNEFSMEDGGGGMKFAATAAKDWEETVLHDKSQKVTAHETLDVGKSNATTVGSNQSTSIGANQTKDVGGNAAVTIIKNRTKSVGASETVTVSGSETEKITGTDTETVATSHTTLAGMAISRTCIGSHSLTVGAAMIQAAGMGASVTVAGARAETVGAAKIVASGGPISETVYGAFSVNVGGACVQVAQGNCTASAKGRSSITVGGVALVNAGDKLQIAAKNINITVGVVAAFTGGGGSLALVPAAASFAGQVTLDASGEVKIQGSPNLVG